MSLKIKRILTYVLCFLLAACVAFGITAIIINASKPVLAEGTETTESTKIAPDKEILEWENKSTYYYEEDGVAYVGNTDNNFLRSGSEFNPYNNIIKKTIVINDFATNGISIVYAPDAYNSYFHPGVIIKTTSVMFRSAWDSNSRATKTVTYNNSAKLSTDVPYTFYFSMSNNLNETDSTLVDSYDIYFKLTSFDGATVYTEYLCEGLKATIKEGATVADKSTSKYAEVAITSSVASKGNITGTNVCEYPRKMAVVLDEYENNEDISYFWNNSAKATADKEDGKQVSNDIIVDGNLTLIAGSYFYTPDFDNRFSFKFKADDSESYFTNNGEVRFQFGQRWSSTYFYLNYKSDKIGIYTHKTTLATNTTSTSFVLDIEKEYKISLVIRDVRDLNGVLVYRYPVMDIAEIGNESTNFATIGLLSNDLVEYNPADSSKLETHFRVDDYQDYYNGNIHGFNCTISAIEPWYEVTTVDGNNTKTEKIKGGDEVVTLTDGADSNKVFLGWITSANETDIYKAGTAPLTADTTYTALYLDTFEVLNYTDMRLVNVQLRFKAAIVAQDWDLVNKYVNWGFDVTDTAAAQVASVQNVVGEDLDFVDGSTTDKTMRITIDLDESQYLTVYTANAFVEITYANSEDGGSETLYADGTCKNSAANVASWAKDNPAEGTTWSDKFIAEFDRIIAGGAAN